LFSFVYFELSVPVQVIACTDCSLKWTIMWWAGRKTLLTHSVPMSIRAVWKVLVACGGKDHR